jgi:thymidylate synthase (FAD)
MNENFVLPKVFFIGETRIDFIEIKKYLEYTNQEEFMNEIIEALENKVTDGEILCSFFAKLCYASLTDSKNKNITKVRSIADNILNTIESKHGSVFEHCSLNFVITDCSRVFTHELVRHRVGTAFSQTSGRYVRNDKLKIVFDPILNEIEEDCEEIRLFTENWYKKVQEKSGLNEMTNFDKKKKMTSALRRFMPNGQTNEIGFSLNLRTLRHLTSLRTSQHAEWEIREVFNQIYELIYNKYSLIFNDVVSAKLINGCNEIIFKNEKI